jgi:predicted phage tail component-like protein
MRLAFTFNGNSSDDFHLKIADIRRPLFPKVNDHRETIPGRAGEILFPQSFGNKPVEVDVVIEHTATDDITRAREIRSIAKMLYTQQEAELIFSDEADVVYKGKISDAGELERRLKYGTATLIFSCQPYAESLETTELTKTFVNGDTLDFTNEGHAESEFIIEVKPIMTTMKSVTIDVNGIEMTLNSEISSTQTLSIDTEEYILTVDSEPAPDKLEKLTGAFPYVHTGANTLTLRFEGPTQVDVLFKYKKRYL